MGDRRERRPGKRCLAETRFTSGHRLIDFAGKWAQVAGVVSRSIDVGEVRRNDLMTERAPVENAFQAAHQWSIYHGHGCSLLALLWMPLPMPALLPEPVSSLR